MNSNAPGSRGQKALALRGDPEAIPGSLLLATIPVGVITYGADGQCTSANEAAAGVLGIRRDRLLEQNFRMLGSWRESGLLAQAEATLQHGHPFDGRLPITTTSGRALCLEWRLRRVELEDAAALLVVFEDVTERDRAEKALRLTQLSIDKSADLIHWLDPAGRFLYVSDSTCERHGYSREELLKMTILDLNPTLTAETWAGRWVSFKDGGSRTFEEVHKTKQGDLFPVEITVNCVESDGLTYAFAYARDITRRVKMEESLRLTQLSVDAATDYVFWLDSKGGFVFVSEAACRRLGHSREELLTMTIFDVDPIAPQPWSEHFREIKERGSFTFETLHMTKAGETFPVEVTVNYVEFNGKAYDFGSCRDITDRKRAEEELRRSHDLLNITGQLAKVGGWELIPETQALTWTEEVYRIHEVDPATRPTVAEAIDFYAPEAQPVISGAVQAAIEAGAPFDLELPLITARGRHIFVRAQGAVERRDGKTVRLYGAFQDITEKKQTEEALHLTQLSVDKAADLIHWTDAEGRLLYVSDSECRRHGYTREELLGMTVFDLDPSLTRERWVELWRTNGEGGSATFETVHRTKQGEVFPVEITTNFIHRDGRDYNFVYARDITDRKRAESELQRSEQTLRALIDANPESALLMDTEGTIVVANEALAARLGVRVQEMVGANMWELLPPSTVEKRKRYAERVVRTGRPVRYEDERYGRVIDNYVQPVFDDQGNVVRLAILGVDLTERMQAEEALRESQERYRAMFEANPLPMFVFDEETLEFISVNDAAVLHYGYSREEFLSMTIGDIRPVEDMPHLWDALAAAKKRPGVDLTEARHRKHDGTLMDVEITSHLFDLGGRRARIALPYDTTDRRRAEAALRQAAERYESVTNTAMDAFWVADLEGHILEANEASLRVYGYSHEEMLALHIADLNVDHSPEVVCKRQRQIAAKGEDRFETRHRRKDGTIFAVEVSARAWTPEGPIGSFTHDISDRKRAETALRIQARTDELTKLPNRRAFNEEVEVSLAEPSARIGLLILDFDRFKEINDSLGHPAGDQLLGMIAARLTGALRSGDTLARLGGDEFAVLVRGGARAESEAVAGRLLGALNQPFRLMGMLLPLSASIGIALAPEHGSRAAELFARADIAMYRAKRLHSGVEVFDSSEGDLSRERLEFQGAFHGALEREELVLHYQPKIDLANGRVVGVEALIRWDRPGYGLVLPDRFLALAQETGMMSRITSFVLGQAMRDCRAWRDLGYDLSVSVNVSAADLVDGDLPGAVISLMKGEGLSPEGLIVEITENTFIADQAQSLEVLERLRAAGVRISIDDYGTGFTSLAYLSDLPIDELKLDRTFIADLLQSHVHEAIVSSTIQLAHVLGLEVVAEGIEDAAILDRLREMGCDLGQGYHIFRPAPADHLLAYLEGSRLLTALPGPSRSRRVKRPSAEPAHLGVAGADRRSGK